MNITSFSRINTKNFSEIDLDPNEVASALANFSDLGAATRAGLFSPVTASASDTVAVEVKADGSAVIVVIIETTTLSISANTSS